MFDFLKRKRRLTDPFFGPLVFNSHSKCWDGQVDFSPVARTIDVRLYTEEAGPFDNFKDAYEALVARYSELKPKMDVLLFDAYSAVSSEDPAECPFDSPEKLSQVLQLEILYIEPSDRFSLSYGFVDSVHSEPTTVLTVNLDAWKPVSASFMD